MGGLLDGIGQSYPGLFGKMTQASGLGADFAGATDAAASMFNPATRNRTLPVPPAQETGPSARAYDPTVSEKLGYLVQSGLSGAGFIPSFAEHMGERTRDLAGFVPGLGTGIAAGDTTRALSLGDYPGAAIAAVGAMPGVGAGAKAVAKTVRRAALPMDEASRLARATEQGYTIDAFKGGQPYHWDSLPETSGWGKVIPGTENRIPKELTSINSPNADYAGFFSNSPNVANRFAAPFEHGAVWPTKLKFENPVIIDAQGRYAAEFQFESLARERGTTAEMDKFKGAFAVDSKHDGVILKNTKDEGDVYVPRNPDQIRSRFAKFDPANIGSGELLGSLAGLGIFGSMMTDNAQAGQ